MPSESAITRLLYAILSQKCLKDIDWNKVAHDPILSQEITNGHAARMRYSRFKKQMEGTQPTTTTRKARNKNKVDKNKPASSSAKKSKHAKHPKNEEDQDDDEEIEEHHAQRIKSEYGHERRHNHTGPGRVFHTPEMDSGSIMLSSAAVGGRVKSEPGLSISSIPMTPMPSTPVTTTSFSTPNYTRYVHDTSASPSPGTSFGPNDVNGPNGSMDDMDEMIASFCIPGASGSPTTLMNSASGPGQEYYRGEPMLGEQGFGMGIGMGGGMQMHMGLGDSYEGLWGARDGGRERGDVKSEPRWEEGYVRS